MIALSMLNPEQRAAVTAPLEPVLVVAGPVAGKTRVLVKRIAFILDIYRQVLAWKLLAVTFTRTAADHMVERLKQESGETRANQVKTYTFHELETDLDESAMVASEIQRLTRRGQVAPSGVAILYRVNAAGRAFEEELVRRGINYMVEGSSCFYERKEILDLLAYLKVLITPDDAEATERMINTAHDQHAKSRAGEDFSGGFGRTGPG